MLPISLHHGRAESPRHGTGGFCQENHHHFLLSRRNTRQDLSSPQMGDIYGVVIPREKCLRSYRCNVHLRCPQNRKRSPSTTARPDIQKLVAILDN
ncbi:hypothetical protein VTO42DRAFT_4191 [Malbranchea cinnamomea]